MTLSTDEARPKRVRLTAAQREAQLLDVAEKLFTENGYEGVTIEDIAQAGGVSRPIVYQHLGTKEGAFLACVRRARAQFEESILASVTLPLDDWAGRIRAGGDVYFDLIATDPQRWSLLFTTSASLEGHLAEELASLRASTIGAIAKSIRPYAPHITKEAVEAFAYIMSGVGEQLGRWWIANPKISRTRVLSYYTASLEGAAQAVLELPHAQKRPST